VHREAHEGIPAGIARSRAGRLMVDDRDKPMGRREAEQAACLANHPAWHHPRHSRRRKGWREPSLVRKRPVHQQSEVDGQQEQSILTS
jgi:hypothetical protein